MARRDGMRIAFVPTMGALHAGHISLIKQALKDGLAVVASIFVNPIQFNNPSDFEKYPRHPQADLDMLRLAGCHIAWTPTEADMYPSAEFRAPAYEPGAIARRLEGASRPGHFQGMCTVVKRMLDVVRPDRAYFGLKDYQQFLIVRQMAAHFNMPVDIVGVPIMREPSGLAMSSRNERLSPESRLRAAAIYENMIRVCVELRHGTPLSVARMEAIARLDGIDGFKTDYLDICSADTLEPIDTAQINLPGFEMIVLAAVLVDEVRLIDNLSC